jgi:hypothetical protein
MRPHAPLAGSRVELLHSRQLLSDSRALITRARELIRQSQQTIHRQTYVQIVCAWCQQTIRWQRTPGAAPGQSSHSICFDCCEQTVQRRAPVHVQPAFYKWAG